MLKVPAYLSKVVGTDVNELSWDRFYKKKKKKVKKRS
jgi:hypothetical protein